MNSIKQVRTTIFTFKVFEDEKIYQCYRRYKKLVPGLKIKKKVNILLFLEHLEYSSKMVKLDWMMPTENHHFISHSFPSL